MKLAQWSSVFALTIAGCFAPSAPDNAQPLGGDDSSTDTGSTSGSQDETTPDAPAQSCALSGPSGSFALRGEPGVNARAAMIAADNFGNVFHLLDNGGVVKLDSNLQRVFSYPHGEVVTVDAQGNAYVAGAFRTATDFGAGVIQPAGNVNVFLVKLSPSGDVLSVSTFGDCGGDGLLSIARDTSSGRVAVSGAAMGTVVVDANGAVVYRLAASGKLAFDSTGKLVVVGAFAGGIDLGNGHRLSTTGAYDFDGFVARYDVDGRYQFSFQLGDVALPYPAFWGEEITEAQNQAVAGVAIGPDDSIALTGEFFKEANLFGQEFSTLPFATDTGSMGGAFIAKIAANGSLAFVRQQVPDTNAAMEIGGVNLFGVENGRAAVSQRPGTAIAVDASGDFYVSNNENGNVPPYAYPQLTKHDGTTGDRVWGFYNSAGPAGYGLGVAVDGCGNVIWADQEYFLSDDGGGSTLYISKLVR